MKKYSSIGDILADDPFDLLKVKPSTSSTITADERLLNSFEEINKFYEENDREPSPNIENISEQQLYFRLKAIRNDNTKVLALSEIDTHGLLKTEQKEISTLGDVIEDDSLGLLNDDPENIFSLKHVKSYSERKNADFVAKRKPCKDFHKYEPLFKKIHNDIKNNFRSTISFDIKQLDENNFYILNGIMLYVSSINNDMKNIGDKSRNRGRTKIIFENGTESNMRFRSLAKQLRLNGRSITKNKKQLEKIFTNKETNINSEDVASGYVYILKSKSDKEEISLIDNLYKIGFSSVEIEERIKNAKNEPTYLMAPVSVITYFECYNFNPKQLEQSLHGFFGDSQLSVDVYDNDGIRHNPKEWFIAPLKVIERAAEMMISGDIVNYRYDRNQQKILSI